MEIETYTVHKDFKTYPKMQSTPIFQTYFKYYNAMKNLCYKFMFWVL